MPDIRSLRIPSDLEKLTEVQFFAGQLGDWAGLDEEALAGVTLALSEAVTNAILHGNKEQIKKEVSIQAERNGNKLVLTVEDEGEGFDPTALPDPLDEENLLKTSGRGVYLMRQFCDDITYNAKGNRVQLVFEN